MNGKRLIILLALLGNGLLLFCQTVYINTEREIYQFSGTNNRVRIDNGCGTDTLILSMALHKDTIYYNTWLGELKRFKVGHPGSCEVLMNDGFTFNSMTVDKNGMIYVGTDRLMRYNPYTNELTDMGQIPFISSGDMIFFRDKLLMAGWDPNDWSTGIFEINRETPAASTIYMSTPPFFGLLSLPVPCAGNRYFGLSPVDESTTLVELNLADKTIIGEMATIPERIMDGASITEAGLDNNVSITGTLKTHPSNCAGNNGFITLSASSVNTPLSYTLLNTGTSQPTGRFDNLQGGTYRFRVKDTLGCTGDTTIVLAHSIPASGCSNDVFIPNAFTPNNDGKNDYFSFSVPAGFKNINLQVYGRWGNVVFAARGSTISWDGSSHGAKQPTGVYIYTFSYTTPDGSARNLKGTLSLLR